MNTDQKKIRLSVAFNIQPRQTLYGCVLKEKGVSKESVEDATFGCVDNKVYVFDDGEMEPNVLGSPHQECVTLQFPNEERVVQKYAYENVARILLARNNPLVDINRLAELASILSDEEEPEIEDRIESEADGFIALLIKAIKEIIDEFSEKFNYSEKDDIKWEIEASLILNSCIDFLKLDNFHRNFRNTIFNKINNGDLIISEKIYVQIINLDILTMAEALEAYSHQYLPSIDTESYWGLCIVDFYNTVFYTATHPASYSEILESRLNPEEFEHFHAERKDVSYFKLVELTRGYIRKETGSVVSSNILIQSAATNKKIVVKNKIIQVEPLMQNAAYSMISAAFRNLPEFWRTSEDIEKLYVYCNGLDTPDFIKALQAVYTSAESISDEFSVIKGGLILNLEGTSELKRYHSYLDIEDGGILFNGTGPSELEDTISSETELDEYDLNEDEFDFSEFGAERKLSGFEDDGTNGLSIEEVFGEEAEKNEDKRDDGTGG